MTNAPPLIRWWASLLQIPPTLLAGWLTGRPQKSLVPTCHPLTHTNTLSRCDITTFHAISYSVPAGTVNGIPSSVFELSISSRSTAGLPSPLSATFARCHVCHLDAATRFDRSPCKQWTCIRHASYSPPLHVAEQLTDSKYKKTGHMNHDPQRP